MKVNLRQTLEFFDELPAYGRGHASGVVAMLGEDLNAAAFKHYMESQGAAVSILDGSITTGSLKGVRLDRWIAARTKETNILYQCEIKNWSAWAIGGRLLKIDASEEETRRVAQEYWNNQYKKVFALPGGVNKVTKVLVPMRVPQGYQDAQVRPLLIYWMPIANGENIVPFFSAKVSDLHVSLETPFAVLHIFSVSLYFRSLLRQGVAEIDLALPHLAERLKILEDILPRG